METNQEYSERYRNLILGKTVKKVLKLRKDFKTLFLLRTEHEILMMLAHCAKRYYQYKKKALTEDEQALYDYLIKFNYNPSTVYKWFLKTIKIEEIAIYPKDIERLSEGRLEKVMNARKKEKDVAIAFNFIELAKKTARGLLENEN